MSNASKFVLPDELCAKEPPEKRGIARDAVRLMVVDRKTHETTHTHFNQLHQFLKPGDLLVLNASRTLPASLSGCESPTGPCMEVRLAEHLPDDTWLALLLCQKGDPFTCGLRSGMSIGFSPDLNAEVLNRDERIPRLWRLHFSKSGSELMDLFYKLGKPIRYEYISDAFRKDTHIDYYQNVYSKQPGSAEMPSAGRAFTWKIIFDLKRNQIDTCDLILHTGLSCYMDDELDSTHPASEEEYFIGEDTIQKIAKAKANGNRVIAVGTTVVRALESASTNDGIVKAGHDYTRLHISGDTKLQVVDGIITGLHEPEASHLDLLNAFLPKEQIFQSYNQAISLSYLWHEFGDLNLIV